MPEKSRLPISGWTLAALVIALVWALYAITLSWLKYTSYHNHSFDLALYARSLWGATRGLPINPIRDQHLLALHGHWILYLLSPLTFVASASDILITLQSVALAFGGLVLFRISHRRLQSPALALTVALIYFVFPITLNSALWDMHPKALAIPFIFLAVDGFSTRGSGDYRSWLWFLLAAACREEVAFLMGLIGLSLILRKETRRAGIAVSIAGFAIFAAYLFVIRPWLGADFASAKTHFADLSLTSVLKADNLIYLGFLLGSLAFLPVLGWRMAWPASAIAVINMVSSHPDTNHPTSHYALLTMPFLLLGVVDGLGLIQRRFPKRVLIAAGASLVCAIVSHALFSLGPGGRFFRPNDFVFDDESANVQICISRIPPNSSVVAPPHVLAHLADRDRISGKLGNGTHDFILLESRPLKWIPKTRGYLKYIQRRRWQADQLTTRYPYMKLMDCEAYTLFVRRR